MKLTLTKDDGTVLKQWDVETDFGDVSRNIPRHLMALEISEKIVRARKQQQDTPAKQRGKP